MKVAGAVVALFFHIVFFRKRRDQQTTAGDLAQAVQNDFGTAIVKFDRAFDFDHVSGEAAHVADIFQIVREDDDGKWAGHLVFTEVDEVNSSRTDFYFEHLARHAGGFSDVSAGVLDGNTV